MEKITRKADVAIARNFINDLKAFGYMPTKAILFGSFVKGTFHQHSDIDLAIWADPFTGQRAIDNPLVWEPKAKYPRVQLHPYHVADTEATDPFISEILSYGIPLEV